MKFLTVLLTTCLCLFITRVTSVPTENLTEKVSTIQEKQEQFQTVIEKTGELLYGFLQDDPNVKTEIPEAGDEVSFVSSPGLILPQITQNLTLNCSWHIEEDKKTNSKLFTVSSVAIQHKDKTIVTYRKGLPDVSVVTKDKNLFASGQFDGKVGYLQMTYKSPSDKQSGTYTCRIGGTDKQGSPDINKKTVDIDLVDYVNLVSRMNVLEEENKNLKNNLNETIFNQLDIIKASAETVPDVFFSVGLGKLTWIEIGKPVIYDIVFTNVGAGYDSNTGNFTAPFTGYYRFEFHLASDILKAQLGIRKNGEFVVEAISFSDDAFDTVSNSCIVLLKKGDGVDVTARTRRSKLLIFNPNYPLNTFSGQLLSIPEE